MQNIFETSIEYAKGIGPLRADMLRKELQIFTFGDLLSYYPFRFVDKTKFYKIKDINEDLPYVQIKGIIVRVETIGDARQKRVVAYFQDETGEMELIWFQGIKWIMNSLKIGEEYIVFGKPNRFKNAYTIAHPELDLASDQTASLSSTLEPVYYSTEKLKVRGFDSKGISKSIRLLIYSLLENKSPNSKYQPVFAETLPDSILAKLNFISRENAIKNIHFPSSTDLLQKAQLRLKFEELFYIQLKILQLKNNRGKSHNGFVFSKIGEYFNAFYQNHLPFELTGAQKRVIKEIRSDVATGKQMNRLIQGDVGSGKTIVALLTMLIAIDNGFQASLMAPTEILANQHFETISELLKGMDLRVGLLTGSTKTKARKDLHAGLLQGEVHILIGTHALIEEAVQFRNLGLAIIDEQHRFGVEQRSQMWKKNNQPPHVLVMTATPIPRTLAMTLYGDLDASIIDELPPGRKPIQTIHRYDSSRLQIFNFMREQIKLGRQVYIVYPLIKESEKLDYKDLMDGYESISRAFPLPEYKISIVHGQMKAADKDFEMQRFIKNETQIMVATTVIEVGVNVPNASIMVIESTERFGLSQLHQLRGRVGRGADQSFCVLMSSHKLSNEAKIRIETMVRTNDGFEIADVDMKLRGPGNIEGTQQSGVLDLKLADLTKDEKLLKYARDLVMELLEEDPLLQKPENNCLLNQLLYLKKGRGNWSRIS